MDDPGIDWNGKRVRNVKARGTRSRSGRLRGPLRRIAGPPDACRNCGGACEHRGLRCHVCAGTGIAA